MHSELRKSLEAQLQASSTSGGGGGVSTVVIDGLRQQLDLLSKERDSYIELWRQTTSELESLQKSEQAGLDDCSILMSTSERERYNYIISTLPMISAVYILV